MILSELTKRVAEHTRNRGQYGKEGDSRLLNMIFRKLHPPDPKQYRFSTESGRIPVRVLERL